MNNYEQTRTETTAFPVQQQPIFPQQQYTTVTTYPPGANPNQPQQYTTVTTYPPGVIPNQPSSYYPVNQQPFVPSPMGYQEVVQPMVAPSNLVLQPTPVVVQEILTPVVIQETPTPVIFQETPTPVIIQETPPPVVVQEINIPVVEEKPFLEKAKETIVPLTEKAKESINLTSEKMVPVTEKAKVILHQTGETLGIIKPHQNIEGPLSEIQEVRQEMGKPKMEQPYHKSLAERAVETWNEAGVIIAPYAEMAKDTLFEAKETIQEAVLEQIEQKSLADRATETWNEAGEIAKGTFYEAKETLHEVGEKIGIVYPRQKIEGPLAEIQDIRKGKGLPRMEQPLWKPVDEMTYTEKTKETLIEAGVMIGPYAEKAKDTLYHTGETLGLIKPHQNIEGPLSEIQEVRQEMGKPKMEQPYHKSLAERAKESFNEASVKIEPFTEKAKETLQQAGEKVGNIVKPPTEIIGGPPVDLKDVRIDMGYTAPVQKPVQKPLVNETVVQATVTIEKDKANNTLYETDEIIGFVQPVQNSGKPLTDRAVRDTWNAAGESIELGKQMGFVNNTQNIEGPLISQIPQVHQNPGFANNTQGPLFGQIPQVQQNPGFANNTQGPFLGQIPQVHQNPGFANNTQGPFLAQNPQFQNMGVQQNPIAVRSENPTNYINERMELFAEKARQRFEMNEQAALGNTGFPTGVQNLNQGQIWEGESPKRGLGFEDARVTKVIENVVVTDTKALPA